MLTTKTGTRGPGRFPRTALPSWAAGLGPPPRCSRSASDLRAPAPFLCPFPLPPQIPLPGRPSVSGSPPQTAPRSHHMAPGRRGPGRPECRSQHAFPTILGLEVQGQGSHRAGYSCRLLAMSALGLSASGSLVCLPVSPKGCILTSSPLPRSRLQIRSQSGVLGGRASQRTWGDRR